jgi:hypothetical protein
MGQAPHTVAGTTPAQVRPLPELGGVFTDARGGRRALRVSWHAAHPAGFVVLSLWDGDRCIGTVRVPAPDVPDLIRSLALGLAAQ